VAARVRLDDQAAGRWTRPPGTGDQLLAGNDTTRTMLGKRRLAYPAALVVLAVLATTCGGKEAPAGEGTVAMESGEVERPISDHFAEAAGLTWHYVEAGQGEPVVFLHGLPESWYSWHYQLEALSSEYRVIAIDLKGYGQSDKSDGDYTVPNVAEEILALLDSIGLEQFYLVSHDWGTVISDSIAGNHPDRILRYVRMEAPLLNVDPANHPQFALFQNQELATQVMSNTEEFIRNVYGPRTVQPIPEADMLRIIEEFSRPGVAEAVPRYFRDFGDFGEELRQERAALFAAMDFPVLLLQGENDPAQPQWYFEGAADLFPDAELQWIGDAGHFTELEQPEQVTKAIRDFLQQ
jgi:pimeloyl-ACP methyl ester carboxylesterase